MLSVNEALAAILERANPLPAEERDLDEALGRVLAEDAVARENLPPFSNSAMDGFAMRASDVAGASAHDPVEIRVLADQPAGSPVSVRVRPGTGVRIMTGAQMPAGADAVVPVEHTAGSGSAVQVLRPVRPGSHVREAGEDVRAGERVAARGQVLRPAELGLLAAIGSVRVRLRGRRRGVALRRGRRGRRRIGRQEGRSAAGRASRRACRGAACAA